MYQYLQLRFKMDGAYCDVHIPARVFSTTAVSNSTLQVLICTRTHVARVRLHVAVAFRRNALPVTSPQLASKRGFAALVPCSSYPIHPEMVTESRRQNRQQISTGGDLIPDARPGKTLASRNSQLATATSLPSRHAAQNGAHARAGGGSVRRHATPVRSPIPMLLCLPPCESL